VDRVAIIDKGSIVALGSLPEIKKQVENSMRIELITKPEDVARVEHILKSSGVPVVTTESRVISRWPSERAQEAIAYVMNQVGFSSVEDFRILTPTLEDIYLELGGKGSLV